MKRYKRHRDYGFFDQDIRLSKLSQLGDPLEKLNSGVDFEIFRQKLEQGLTKVAKGKGGRPPYDYVLMFKILILQRYYNLSDEQTEYQINDPPYDYVLMFKILILQRYYNLSDEQTEYQINDRMSFMRFLDLTIADDIPDSRTIWKFTEQITDLELTEPLFKRFEEELVKLNLIVNEGKIIDASFVEAPRQRNSKEENARIKKEGAAPKQWEESPEKLAQKDVDARWTKKNNQTYYGYKNHTKVDSESKLISNYLVTDASVHDSQALDQLLEEKDKGEQLYADSAYTGQEEILEKYQVKDQIHEKGARNRPLTDDQKKNNKIKSKTRARVEHIFGFMENSMGSMYFRKVGRKRAETVIGLMNLTYNMFRKVQLQQASVGTCL
jgi:IS5 family transposase